MLGDFSPTKTLFAWGQSLRNTTPVHQPSSAEEQRSTTDPEHTEQQDPNGNTPATNLPIAPANQTAPAQYNTELRLQLNQLRVEGTKKNNIEDEIYNTIKKIWNRVEQNFAAVATGGAPEEHAVSLIRDDELAKAAFKCTVDRLERLLIDVYNYKERKNLDTLARGLCDDKRHLLAVLFGPRLLFKDTNRGKLFTLYNKLIAEEKLDANRPKEQNKSTRLARICAELNQSREDRLKTKQSSSPFYTPIDVKNATDRIAKRIGDVKQPIADKTNSTQAQLAAAPNNSSSEDNRIDENRAEEEINSDDETDIASDTNVDPNGQTLDDYDAGARKDNTEIETVERNTGSNDPDEVDMSATSYQTAATAMEQQKRPAPRNPLTPAPSVTNPSAEHSEEELPENEEERQESGRPGSGHRNHMENAGSSLRHTPPPSATKTTRANGDSPRNEQRGSSQRTPLPGKPITSQGKLQQNASTIDGQGNASTKSMPPPDSELNRHAHGRIQRQQPKPSVTLNTPSLPSKQQSLKRKTVDEHQEQPEPNSKRQRTTIKHAQARSPIKTPTVPPKYPLQLFRYTRPQAHREGVANTQQTTEYPTVDPRATKNATPSPGPADVYLTACRDLQDRVKEIPELQSLLAEYDSVTSSTRWAGTLHEYYAKMGRNIIDNGTIPKMWTIGSPGGPIFPGMEQVHGLTDHKYEDADCLLLTRNQHQTLLAAGWGCDKVILLRDPISTQPSGPDHSLTKKLKWFDSVADIWGSNKTTASTRRLDVKTNTAHKHRSMTMKEVVDTLSTAKPLKDRPPSNFLDLQGTPGGTPPGLVRYADLLRDVCLAASTLEEQVVEDGKTRFFGLVGNPLTNAGTGALQYFEIIGERGTVSAPHMDMYGATTYCTLEKQTDDWKPTVNNTFDSLKLWPLLPTHTMKREDALKVYDTMEQHGVGLIDNLPPGPNGTSCRVPLILMLTGDTIIMPPGTIHFPISITTAYMTGGMVWHKDMLAQTLDFWAYCASKKSSHTTNQDTKWTHLTIATALKHFISTGTLIESILPHHASDRAACQDWLNKVYHQITNQGLGDSALHELPTNRQLQLRKIVKGAMNIGESLPVHSRTRK